MEKPKFNSKEYRDNLAKDLKDIRRGDSEKAQQVLEEEQQTTRYKEAKEFHIGKYSDEERLRLIQSFKELALNKNGELSELLIKDLGKDFKGFTDNRDKIDSLFKFVEENKLEPTPEEIGNIFCDLYKSGSSNMANKIFYTYKERFKMKCIPIDMDTAKKLIAKMHGVDWNDEALYNLNKSDENNTIGRQKLVEIMSDINDTLYLYDYDEFRSIYVSLGTIDKN